MTRCPLCGHAFDPAKAMACRSCAAGRSCAMLCCPNCGYNMPGESRLARLIKGLLRGMPGAQAKR